MSDILTRILIGGLGVILIFLGVSMLVVRGIASSIRSIFAPRIIIVQNDSTYKRQPSLIDTFKPIVMALIWLTLLLVFFDPHSRWSLVRANQTPGVTRPIEPHPHA